ncbi:MAG: diaminopimelate decarboxylase [Lachnospiraceae bacterium]|nr:diaminopimelate decarboxylase [Lachnospiraceae bacterium]
MISTEQLKQIADCCKTPAFLFDAAEVRARAGKIRQILNDGVTEGQIGLCYSIKANPFLIPYLTDCVNAFEVCSPGELSICKFHQIPAEKIIYSGVNKELTDIREAVCYAKTADGSDRPVRLITAESVKHYELIRRVAEETGIGVKIILRVSSKNQFGMDVSDIEAVLEKNRGCTRTDIAGLHYFAGTQRMKLKHQQEELAMLKALVEKLRASFDLPLPLLEYGPGLPFPYFADEDRSDTLLPLKDLTADLQDIHATCSLTVEMGRFLASSCGYYFTSVVDVKTSFDHRWCILDGGINHVNYLGSMMGLKVPVIRVLSDTPDTAPIISQALCGSLCTTADVLVRSFDAPALKEGDKLVFENIGAYSVTEGLNLFLSRDMPSVFISGNGQITKVREGLPTWRINTTKGTMESNA